MDHIIIGLYTFDGDLCKELTRQRSVLESKHNFEVRDKIRYKNLRAEIIKLETDQYFTTFNAWPDCGGTYRVGLHFQKHDYFVQSASGSLSALKGSVS